MIFDQTVERCKAVTFNICYTEDTLPEESVVMPYITSLFPSRHHLHFII